jgi:hypothetical protein
MAKLNGVCIKRTRKERVLSATVTGLFGGPTLMPTFLVTTLEKVIPASGSKGVAAEGP